MSKLNNDVDWDDVEFLARFLNEGRGVAKEYWAPFQEGIYYTLTLLSRKGQRRLVEKVLNAR